MSEGKMAESNFELENTHLVLYFFVLVIVIGMLQNEIGILLGVPISFFLWMLARIFRMAVFEVEKIRDSNLLIAIFSGTLSFVSVIIVLVALIVDKVYWEDSSDNHS